MQNVTALVISFLRPAYTKACIASLRKMYPGIHILVGENGTYDEDLAATCKQVRAKYIQLPFDSGICVARNMLLKLVATEFVLVGDDDFYYTETAQVDCMADFLQHHPEYDLIGGRVIESGVLKNYQGYTEKVDRHFVTTPLDLENAPYKTHTNGTCTLRYTSADLTFNYFVARTAKLLPVPWDSNIKVAYEHYTWFWDFKQAGGKVAFSPDPMVIHKPEGITGKVLHTDAHTEYLAYRNRKSDKEYFFKRHNVDYTIDMNGTKNYSPNHTVSRTKNDTKHVDFCITTFMRPQALERLLLSIAKYYPMANVYVADQNEVYDRAFYRELQKKVAKAGLIKRPSFRQLPYDCGLSYARNYLVTNTPNKYKLILDDDMVFTGRTNLGAMVALMENVPQVGIVGGALEQLTVPVHFEFKIEIKDGTIYHKPDGDKWRKCNGITYKHTGCVLNFALMRSDLFNFVAWDNNLKVTEHLDFYIRMQQVAYGIVYTPDSVIDHPPVDRSHTYKEFRQRPEYQVHMLRKHKATRVKYLNGQVVEVLPNGDLKRYKETPQNG